MDFERIHVLVKIHSIDNIIDLAFRRTIAWQEYLCKIEKCLKHVYCMSCLINYKHPLFEQYYAKQCNGSQQFMTTSLYPKRFTKASKPFPILHIFMGDWLPHRVIDWFFHIPFMCAVTMKRGNFLSLAKCYLWKVYILFHWVP